MQLCFISLSVFSYESKSTCKLCEILRMRFSLHVLLEGILHVLFSEWTVPACVGPNGANFLAKVLIYLAE